MWRAMVVCVGAAASTAAAGPLVISHYENGMLEWEDSISNGAYSVEWAAHPDGPWNPSWATVRDIPATGGVMQVAAPMFFRVAHSTGSTVFEDFEDQSGWMDHSLPGWRQHARSGFWYPFYSEEILAVSNPANAHSGDRYLDISGGEPQILILEGVRNPDHISYWVRAQGRFGASISVQATQDVVLGPWVVLDQTTVTSLAYQEIQVDVEGEANPPITALRFLIQPGTGIFLDDVTITTSD